MNSTLEALKNEARRITEEVNRRIREHPDNIFKVFPEDTQLCSGEFEKSEVQFRDFSLQTCPPDLVCLTELAAKGDDYLQDFLKRLFNWYTGWGVYTLKANLENFVIRFSDDGKLTLPTEKFPGGDDSVRGYFKPVEGGTYQFVRVHGCLMEVDGTTVTYKGNPDYDLPQIVVEGETFDLCRLLADTHPESFRRCGLFPGSRYFDLSIQENVEESLPGKIRVVSRHKFRVSLDKPELSTITAYLP